ncbi:Hypothetical protein R9X50_00173400 [Acrodontium crateriforme]|uniref:SnoaL-like domain-containing protein n=1 Tax=Acrodontium crateriforme TaxID=150365 RepID=A0AAQ3RAA7_9PEZI|nr:Hypothetical protein R9X50_00173400 [Acrodontium crateriforme]
MWGINESRLHPCNDAYNNQNIFANRHFSNRSFIFLMRSFIPRVARSLARDSGPIPRATAYNQGLRTMASSTSGELKIESTNIKTAPGVELDDEQRKFVGSVLDLFAGRPSLAKLQLWKDDAEFADPITIARGRKQFEPQWYGLQAAFSKIEPLHHEVTSSGNPIEIDMKSKYVVKGIGKEAIIESKVNIYSADGKIVKVEDKWNGKLPDSSIANAFRRLNAVTVPTMVSVPKNAEEDAKKGNQ